MRLLLDMNLSPRLAALLSGAGFDAVHWSRSDSIDLFEVKIKLDL